MSTWEQKNRKAWEIGYENASQRSRLRDVARGGRSRIEDNDELLNLIREREEEGDYASIGEIFEDLLGPMGWQRGDDETVAFLRGIFSPSSM